MPKYLHHVRYSADGLKAVAEGGGNARRAAAQRVIESAGGRFEAFYFAFGSTDAYVIAELPDEETAAALALTIGASGLAEVETVVLLTPDQVDIAGKMSVDYRPPGR